MSGSADPMAQIAWEPSLPPTLLVIAGAAAAVLLFWSYLRLKGHPVTATGYLLLRLFGMALVVAALAGPTGVLPAAKRRSREMLVLVDASLSMKNDRIRISDSLLGALSARGADHLVKYFGRDTAGDVSDVDASATNLSVPLLSAAKRMPRAALLVTDGLTNAGGNALKAWKPAAGRVFAVYPERRPPAFRLNPAPGQQEMDDAPGLLLPRRASSGQPFKVVVRTLASPAPETGGLGGTLRVWLKGPVRGPGIGRLKTVGKAEKDFPGGTLAAGSTGSSRRDEFSFTAPRSGYYLVEAEAQWPEGRDQTAGFVEILPGPLDVAYLEGLMSWRTGLLRSFSQTVAEEIALSPFRLYTDDVGAVQALSEAETIVLGAFPKKDLPVPLRVGLNKALARGVGLVLLWTSSSARWLDLLSLAGPSLPVATPGAPSPPTRRRIEGNVKLVPQAAQALGCPPFEFDPVWMEAWRFGRGFEVWFQGGVGGHSPCWSAPRKNGTPPGRHVVFLQDAALKSLLSGPAGREFLAASLYRAAGRKRSGTELRLSLSNTRVPPGGIIEIRAAGRVLSQQGSLVISFGPEQSVREVHRNETGRGRRHTHAIQVTEPGVHLARARFRGVDKEIEAWAACLVEGAGVEDPLLAPDKALLSALAERSGGIAVSEQEMEDALAAFLKDLPEPQPLPAKKESWRTLWLLWAAILAALFIEWALRTR